MSNSTTDEPGPLLGAADIRELAAALGVRPTKQRGQNFVIDANTVRRIVRTAEVRPDDVVVEVGPGLGSLTLALLEAADRVTAVEIDDVLAAALPSTVEARLPGRADRFALVHSDAMLVRELPGPAPTALVANLPYNVAVPVLLHMLATFPTIDRTLVMVQSEVADRLAARPGNKVYGVPSVKANWYAEVKRAGAIGRNVFWPAPNVDSGLVSLVRREKPVATTASRADVFAVVDAAFAQRRKTLRAALAGWAGSAAAAEAALVAAGVSPQARGEALTVEEFARIAEHKPGREGGAGVTGRSAVTVRVPAKVNVQLAVGGARADGFHDLANVFLAVGLYDEVTAAPAESLRVTAAGPDVDRIPLDRTNLAARAAELLAARYGLAPDVHLHIAKDIPVAGGMAGGSADAAGALVACDALWGTGASRDELLAICAELGSDVPFSLVGGVALGRGRGELLTPLEVGGTFHWVFAVADGGLSTPAVYREFDRLNEGVSVPEPVASGALVEALAAGDAVALAGAVSNDLQAAAVSLRPSLVDTLEAGGGAGALAALVSGSGPTTAFLAKDADAAAGVAAALMASGTCRVARVAAGPVPGATVV
ncbi:Ribosomal RNA small subunit methyltransferase A [Streptomyces rimosus subsp. rimosus]